MKYHKLNIYTGGTAENYNEISRILGVQPTKLPEGRLNDNPFDVWVYNVEVSEEEPYFDFINGFLDILEPNFSALEKINITKDKITFWLLYEYDQQCGMEFHPQEMKRLGESGIAMCIDCWQRS